MARYHLRTSAYLHLIGPDNIFIKMKNSNQKIILFAVILLGLIFSHKVSAASLIFRPSTTQIGVGGQLYIDLLLDTEGQPINTIGSTISFSEEMMSFVRAEDGKSMVNLWIEKPNKTENQISFAGIMTNGFDGVIDPFEQSHKLPGLIIRLVFQSTSPGKAYFSTINTSLNLNDGLGTEIKPTPAYLSIEVVDRPDNSQYTSTDESIPFLEANVIQDPNIYNGKYVLIFSASDKGSGVKNVMIKEGRRDWKVIESPYLLTNQSRINDISLVAVSYAGSAVSLYIPGIPYDWKSLIIVISITIIMVLCFYIFAKKKYAKKK